jgi:hypothetical protein
MSEPGGGPRVSALGVVDPMRLPIPPGIARRWARLPALGRVFVGLAILDAVGRAAGLLHPPMFFGLSDPIVFVAQVFPRTLVILLPALILGRRADAAWATPLILRGAVVLALVELIAPQLMRIFFASLAPQNLVVWTLLSLVAALAKAWAWVTIGLGLRSLTASSPSPNVAGFANLVAGALAAVAILGLVATVTGTTVDLGDPESDRLYLFASTFFVLEALAMAFVARVVIRGVGDPRRPAIATRLAAIGFGVLGVVGLIDLVLGLANLVRMAFGLDFALGYGSGSGQIQWTFVSLLAGVGSLVATSLFLVAFALGLADPSAEATAEAAPRNDGPAWPEPGGEPPTFDRPGTAGTD